VELWRCDEATTRGRSQPAQTALLPFTRHSGVENLGCHSRKDGQKNASDWWKHVVITVFRRQDFIFGVKALSVASRRRSKNRGGA